MKWAGKGHHPVLSCVMSQHTTKNSCCLHSRDGGFPGARHFYTQCIHMIYSTLVYHRLSIHKMNRLVVFPQSRSYSSHADSMCLENTLQLILFSPLELLYLNFFFFFNFYLHNCWSSSTFLLIFSETYKSEKCFGSNFGTSLGIPVFLFLFFKHFK